MIKFNKLIEIPTGNFAQVSEKGKYFVAGIQSVISLNRKLAETNSRLRELEKQISNSAKLLENASTETAKKNTKHTKLLVRFTAALVLIGCIHGSIMLWSSKLMKDQITATNDQTKAIYYQAETMQKQAKIMAVQYIKDLPLKNAEEL